MAVVLGALLVIAGMATVFVMFRTQVGLTYESVDSYSLVMPVDCGSKIEWVFGGGPSLPHSRLGLDGADVRTLCHERYDDEIGAWRAQFAGAIGAALAGMVIGTVAGRGEDEEKAS